MAKQDQSQFLAFQEEDTGQHNCMSFTLTLSKVADSLLVAHMVMTTATNFTKAFSVNHKIQHPKELKRQISIHRRGSSTVCKICKTTPSTSLVVLMIQSLSHPSKRLRGTFTQTLTQTSNSFKRRIWDMKYLLP